MSVEGRPLDEAELIKRSIDGDTSAFEQLVLAHQGVALRVAYLVLRNHAEAEDVTQEAFVKAYRSLSGFRVGSPFRPWLFRIVRNEALNSIRGSRRRELREIKTSMDPVSGDAAPSPETEALEAETRRLVLAALGELPLRFRQVLEHRFLLDLTEGETAAVLGIPAGTVKSRTARALKRMETAIEGFL